MEGWIALAALVIATFGSIGAVAYRSARWDKFHSTLWPVLVAISGTGALIAGGLWFAWLFPEQVGKMLAAVGALVVASIVLLLLVEFAHWLREP